MRLSLQASAAIAALSVCLAMPTIAQQSSSAAESLNALVAPVPTPLLNGKRAFISYELGDATAFPSPTVGARSGRTRFFARMKAWGRFELVLDPSDADVVFGVRFVNSPGMLSADQIGHFGR